ncbi:hypothetical protein B0H14DRAFT_3567814 [Mycena olivaceomarginata]|nr:hypothetical protein B0H14DRAFT_3567814 [Mycena olivaceomarginata]
MSSLFIGYRDEFIGELGAIRACGSLEAELTKIKRHKCSFLWEVALRAGCADGETEFLHYYKLLGPPGVHTFHYIEPFTRTFVEDASGWRASEVVFGGSNAVTCSFGTAGRGTCIESVPIRTTTIVATYSGSVVPFHTLAASTPTKSLSPTPSLTARSSTPSTTAPLSAAVQNAAFSFSGAVFLLVGWLFNFL